MMKGIPFFLALLCTALCLSFSDATNHIPPEQIKKAKEIIASVSVEEIGEVNAKAKFKVYCTACHGLDGDLEMNGSKKLSESTLNLEESVAQIYFGAGMMTPFEELLTNAEIVALAQFIEKEFRN